MSDELRSILRKGDPAAGDPGLAPEEVRAMRRTVLSAVPEPRRRGWLVPAMATAALILAAVIALSLWPTPPEEVVAVRPLAVRPPAVRPPLPLAGEGSVQAEKTPPHRPAAGQKKPARRAPAPQPVVVAQADSQRQIQFSTPGGTRVIWVLHPATE